MCLVPCIMEVLFEILYNDMVQAWSCGKISKLFLKSSSIMPIICTAIYPDPLPKRISRFPPSILCQYVALHNMAIHKAMALQVMLLMQAWSSTQNMVNSAPIIKFFSTCVLWPACECFFSVQKFKMEKKETTENSQKVKI